MILEKYGGPKWYWHEECKMAKYMIFNWACWSFGHSCVKTPPINAKYIDFFFFFFFFLLIKYIDLILVPLCILILKFLLNNKKKDLKFFIYLYGLAKVSNTPMSRHRLMPKFKYIDFI